MEWLTHLSRLSTTPSLGTMVRSGKERRHVQLGIGGPQSPESVIVRLNYAERLSLVCTSGVQGYMQVRADCFDPNLTGTGGQPVGFDQWMTFYSAYQVRRFRFQGVVAQLAYLSFIAGMSLPSTAPLTGVETIADVWSGPNGKLVVSGGNPAPILDSGWINVHDVLGLTEAEFKANEDTWGTASAIAPLYAIWGIVNQTVDAATSATTPMMAKLELEVCFFERKRLVMS